MHLAATRPGSPPQHHIPLSGHIAGLDGLRGVAIILVLLYHMTVMTPICALDRAWSAALGVGWCGVDLFFVLSGFLITGILADARGAPHFFRNFYARRALRIFPLYYAVVFFSLVALPALADLAGSEIVHRKLERFGTIQGSEIWYWTYLSNFSIAAHNAFRHGILDVSWSLAIEEQFYLLWPALVWALHRHTMIRLCWLIIVGACLLRVVLCLAGAQPIQIYVLTPTRLDALAAGALVALLARDRAGGILSLRPAARPLLVLGLGSAAAFLALESTLDADAAQAVAWQAPRALLFTALAAGFAGLLIFCVCAPAGSALATIMSNRLLTTFGALSYAIYLFHLPLRAAIRDLLWFFGQDAMPPVLGSRLPVQLVFYVVATGVVLLAAWLSWHLYEKQFLRLKRFFPYRPAPLANAPAPPTPAAPSLEIPLPDITVAEPTPAAILDLARKTQPPSPA